MSQTTLTTPDGQPVGGYFNPGTRQDGHAVVLVIHEIFGLNDQIRTTCDRIAREGVAAFGVDLFQGRTTTSIPEGRQLAGTLRKEQLLEDLKRAVAALRHRDPQVKVGIMGFCMGGGIAIGAAAEIPELVACVPFYGLPSTGGLDSSDLRNIKARIQGHFASRDEYIPVERVNAVEARLREAGVPVEIHWYDAPHGFGNELRPDVYSPEDTRLAWSRAMTFLKETLR